VAALFCAISSLGNAWNGGGWKSGNVGVLNLGRLMRQTNGVSDDGCIS